MFSIIFFGVYLTPIQAYRRPIEDFTSSPYDDIIVDDNWDSQRINHGIIKRADTIADSIADKRPKYLNKKSTTVATTEQSEPHEAIKIADRIPVYRVRGKNKAVSESTDV